MARFNERLKELREERRLSQNELADQLRLVSDYKGVSKSSINMYERGEREPSFETLETMADYFNVDMDFLLGKSEHRTKAAWLATLGKDGAPDNLIPMPGVESIPLIGEIACGKPILAVEDATETVTRPDFVHADFALRCKGDSMINARIFDGDIVYIRRQPDVANGQIAAVRIGEEATLKRVYKQGSRLILRAANPLYEDMIYEGWELEDVQILGLAVAFTSVIK